MTTSIKKRQYLRTRDLLLSLWPAEDMCRTVGQRVLHGQVNVSDRQLRHALQWTKEATSCRLPDGPDAVHSDVLAKAPLYERTVLSFRAWLRAQGFPKDLGFVDQSPFCVSLVPFHHDIDFYRGRMFAVLWLSEDCGLDLAFSDIGLRIPLQRGTVAVFDTGQPHSVLLRNRKRFDALCEKSVFRMDADENEADTSIPVQSFASFELPASDPRIASLMDYRFHDNPQTWPGTVYHHPNVRVDTKTGRLYLEI